MRSCLWRCRHLSQDIQWSLLLALLVFLFALLSFIKDPQTKPSRMVRALGHPMQCQGMGMGR
uniref:ST6 N-acetylgalactosaminide alpha-2,6-sialyltransferase 1 n=1 Tax=Rhinopithecus bieti TaxID=61621 RepID=A0A2K6MZT6_RHIBE